MVNYIRESYKVVNIHESWTLLFVVEKEED